MQQNRGYLPDPAVGSYFVKESTPILDLLPGGVKAHEPISIQAFTMNLLLKASMNALSVGLPGREKSRITLFV